MPNPRLLSAGQFQKLTGLSAAQIRLAEAAGHLAPMKSSSGWRCWPESQVARGRELKAKQASRRRGGWPQKESGD